MKQLKYKHALVYTYRRIEYPYSECAALSLSSLRAYHIEMDFKSFVNYFESLCVFIRDSGFSYISEKWRKEHKRFTSCELSDYYMNNYYYKLLNIDEVVGNKLN